MALRPLLGLMAECLYPQNGKVQEADIRRMSLHLNAQMAGDIEKFLTETQAKLTYLAFRCKHIGYIHTLAFATDNESQDWYHQPLILAQLPKNEIQRNNSVTGRKPLIDLHKPVRLLV